MPSVLFETGVKTNRYKHTPKVHITTTQPLLLSVVIILPSGSMQTPIAPE